jgi:hypothetical protein
MKRLGLSLLLVFITQISSWAQEGTIQVEVKQNGKIVTMDNGVINLKSGEFAFEVESFSVESFLVGATFDKDLYRSAIGEADLEVPWFENTAFADEMYNPNKELIVSDEAPSYWFYTNANDHRFDKNPKGNTEHWIGNRTIKILNNLSNYETIPLTKYKGSVFVYFYTPIYDEDYNMTEVIIHYQAELKFN